MSGRIVLAMAALALGMPASPAAADTKAGVDAFMRGEYEAAIRIWRPLAIAGDADAQYNLGQAYWLGRGVAADPRQAEDWYRRAADQNQPKARDAYGLLLFQTGRRQEAMPFIEESAGRGMPQAQYVYATALFNGDLVEKDWVRAYALMTRASAGGVAAASAGLAQLDKVIPLDQRQRGLQLARAFELADARPQIESAPSQPIRPTELPPSMPVAKPPVLKTGPSKVATAKAATAPKVASTPKPIAKAAKAPAPVGGNWKIQLGAFGDGAKASTLWGTLRTRIAALGPYRSFIVPAGSVTRLQAGPLPSRAAADKLCASVRAMGNACLPVAP